MQNPVNHLYNLILHTFILFYFDLQKYTFFLIIYRNSKLLFFILVNVSKTFAVHTKDINHFGRLIVWVITGFYRQFLKIALQVIYGILTSSILLSLERTNA